MSTLGDRIRDARENKNLYQGQLAELIGVRSAAVISNWEKGINKPDADKIVRLCESLGISVSYLLDYSGEDSLSLKPHEVEHLKKYRELDGHGKEMVDMVLAKEHERWVTSSMEESGQQVVATIRDKMRAQKVD